MTSLEKHKRKVTVLMLIIALLLFIQQVFLYDANRPLIGVYATFAFLIVCVSNIFHTYTKKLGAVTLISGSILLLLFWFIIVFFFNPGLGSQQNIIFSFLVAIFVGIGGVYTLKKQK